MLKHAPRKKTEVTNDQLARMIATGFAETATKQDLLAVEKRLDGRIDGVENRLGGIEVHLEKVEGRLTVVESKLDRALYAELTHIEARLRRVEHKVGIKL
jgi:hypothetical protein